MRRLLALALPTLLLLAAPVGAAAKEITAAKVCGSDRCTAIDADEALLMGGQPVVGPSQPESFVRLAFRIGVPGHSERLSNYFLPGSGFLLADDGTWMLPTELAQLREQVRFVMPFAAKAMPTDLRVAFEIPESPPATAAQPAPAADAGGDLWWIAAPTAVLVLGLGWLLARRRRREGRGDAAEATGVRA
jgi:hypothetical protein